MTLLTGWVNKTEHFKVGNETFNDSGKVHGNWPACPMILLVCPSFPKISYIYIVISTRIFKN